MIMRSQVRPFPFLTCVQLTREYQNIQKNPPPFIVAHPSESNILECVLSHGASAPDLQLTWTQMALHPNRTARDPI